MIRGYDVYPVVLQGPAKRFPVAMAFYRRVAFDKGPFELIIPLVEKQVVNAGLDGDALMIERTRFEQLQLPGRGQVQYVQAGAVSARQFDRKGR